MSRNNSKGRLKKLIAAFICWCKGYDQFPDTAWRRQARVQETLGENIVILRGDIPKLLNSEDFIEGVHFWADYKSFGAPYGGGYMDWPCQVYDIIKCFDRLYMEYKVNDQ